MFLTLVQRTFAAIRTPAWWFHTSWFNKSAGAASGPIRVSCQCAHLLKSVDVRLHANSCTDYPHQTLSFVVSAVIHIYRLSNSTVFSCVVCFSGLLCLFYYVSTKICFAPRLITEACISIPVVQTLWASLGATCFQTASTWDTCTSSLVVLSEVSVLPVINLHISKRHWAFVPALSTSFFLLLCVFNQSHSYSVWQ